MKDSEKKPRCSIDINDKTYTFHCSGGQEHANSLRNTVMKAIESLSLHNSSLSNHAVKIALVLADENIGMKKDCERRLEEMEEKAELLAKELNDVLISR